MKFFLDESHLRGKKVKFFLGSIFFILDAIAESNNIFRCLMVSRIQRRLFICLHHSQFTRKALLRSRFLLLELGMGKGPKRTLELVNWWHESKPLTDPRPRSLVFDCFEEFVWSPNWLDNCLDNFFGKLINWLDNCLDVEIFVTPMPTAEWFRLCFFCFWYLRGKKVDFF